MFPLVFAAAAFAQDADTFSFSGSALDDQGTLQLAHPTLGQADSYYAALGLVLADKPLVVRYEDGTEEVLVGKQFSTRVQGGYNINGFTRVDVDVPVYPAVQVNGTSQFAMGDITLGAMFPVAHVGDSNDGVDFGLRPQLILPTGRNAGAFTSRDTIGGSLTAAAGGYVSQVGWRANLGFDFGPKTSLEDLDFGSSFLAGLGGSYKPIPEAVVGAELDSRVTLSGGTAWNKNPVEGHVYGGYLHESGFHALLGLGTGIIAGVGAPNYRLGLSLGYRNDGGPGDTDGDGLTDDVDRCIEDPEDFDRYQDTDGCPEPDNDGDGLLDLVDECPDAAEDIDGWEDGDGCPDPDNDGDGIPDGGDDCPDVAGPASTNGCPDTDGDGLADDYDKCPTEAGPLATEGCPDRDSDRVPDYRDECPDDPIDPKADPRRSNGCPSKVIVTAEAIVITEKVYFNTGRSTIKPVSYSILDEVAAVFLAHEDIKRVEVAGHTDSDGSDASNKKLSQARAEAVKTYLEGKGVASDRLTAVGYGEEVPVDSNKTREGKANNRRVEFVITEQ
ncbi:MAG: OmpA family protein [Proteobacteria bacterium]|nr:OmpA family protein [Pseudomonadota bacterium]MCP4919693.1 OmpA family protein [Pseudomonadota bacterium]